MVKRKEENGNSKKEAKYEFGNDVAHETKQNETMWRDAGVGTQIQRNHWIH